MLKHPLLSNRFLISSVTAACALALSGCGSSSKISVNGAQTGTAATSTGTIAVGGSQSAGTVASGSVPGARSGSTSTVQSGSLSGQTTTTTTTSHTTTSTKTTTTHTKTTTDKSGNHTKTVTKTVTHTITQVLTAGGVASTGNKAKVLKRIAQGMPAAAFAQSSNLAVTDAFTVSGRNITCILYASGPSCAVFSHSWRAPAGLRHCGNAGTQFQAFGTGLSSLSCVGSSLSYPRGNIVANATDVISSNGKVVCQVRAAGVACFVLDGHGFTISRTGYLTY